MIAARISKTEGDADKYDENRQPQYFGKIDTGIETIDNFVFLAGFDSCGQGGGNENDNAENAPGADIHCAVLPKDNSDDYIPCNGETGGAEEYPAETYEYIGENAGDNVSCSCTLMVFAAMSKLHPKLVDAKSGTMQSTPCHEGPGGTVPKSADKHGEEEVDICARCAPSVSAKGNIEIFHQPC